MKIGVYAISKNESCHVEEWLKAVSEADAVCVTDTGSTDDTTDKLWKGKAKISTFDDPFRFDNARNYALEAAKFRAPGMDIWVSLDLDEMPEPGWRQKLEAAAGEDIQGWRIIIDNGSYSFRNVRCHRAEGWEWRHACHEVLYGPGPLGEAGFKVIHKQDSSKPRDYLPLLELDAKENPEDGRAWHYLGREYMYLGRWKDAENALKSARDCDTWDEQIGRTHVFLSRCDWHQGHIRAARANAYNAIKYYGSREAWVHLAWLLNELGDPTAAIAADNALKIKKQGLYPSEPSAWSEVTEAWLKNIAEVAS